MRSPIISVFAFALVGAGAFWLRIQRLKERIHDAHQPHRLLQHDTQSPVLYRIDLPGTPAFEHFDMSDDYSEGLSELAREYAQQWKPCAILIFGVRNRRPS